MTTSTILTDYSANNLALSKIGNPIYDQDCPLYGCEGSILFDGSSAIKVPYVSGLNPGSGAFTIELQVYITSATSGCILTNNGLSSGTPNPSYQILFDGTYLHWVVYKSDGTMAGSLTGSTNIIGTPALNTWNLVTFTRDAAGKYYSFLNGVLGYNVSYGSTALFPDNTQTNGIMIGAMSTTVFGEAPLENGFIGKIANIRIKNGVCDYTAAFTPNKSVSSNYLSTSIPSGTVLNTLVSLPNWIIDIDTDDIIDNTTATSVDANSKNIYYLSEARNISMFMDSGGGTASASGNTITESWS